MADRRTPQPRPQGSKRAAPGGAKKSRSSASRGSSETVRAAGGSRSSGGFKSGSKSSRRSSSERGRSSRGAEGEPRGRESSQDRRSRQDAVMPKNWGSVARRGAHLVRSQSPKAKNPAPVPSAPQEPQDEWIRVDGQDKSSPEADAPKRHRAAADVPGDVAAAIRRSASDATSYRRERLVEQMGKAAEAYTRHRYEEAARSAGRLAGEVPDVPEVRELAGLAAYRSGRWRPGATHLEAYRTMKGDGQYIPIEMDCQRGIGRVRSVSTLFELLRQESPSPDVLAEGRLVLAGSLADRGKLGEAIELLESNGASKPRRNPGERHLRQWYVLGDLYDRSGDVPRARILFTMVAESDPNAYDVTSRLKDIGPTRKPRQRKKSGGKRTA